MVNSCDKLDQGADNSKRVVPDSTTGITATAEIPLVEFTAEVMEANDALLVTPNTDSNEYKSSDKIAVNVRNAKIIDKAGEKAMGKPEGTYITIDIPEFTHYDAGCMDEVSKVLAKTLTPLLKLDESMTALVVGLGNWNVTPDALGPKVISKLMVTRHLKQLVPDSIDEGIRPVCALAPGVLGLTGIETSEIIE